MADKTIEVPAATIPIKDEVVKKLAKTKNSKPKPTHPSTADMVTAAIKALAERNGSSLQAIKKYIATTYKVDTDKHGFFIKKYLKTAVIAGNLVQSKGKGATGSFKLAVKKSEAVKARSKVKVAKKEESPRKAVVKKPVAKKTEPAAKQKTKKEASPKKAAIKKVAAVKKAPKLKAAKATKDKSPKAKKVTKAPTAKPKAPKPKKVSAVKPKPAARKPRTTK